MSIKNIEDRCIYLVYISTPFRLFHTSKHTEKPETKFYILL